MTSPASAHAEDHAQDVPLESLPKYTEEDAKRDIASLTIHDLVALQSDLTGMQVMTAGMSGLALGGDSAVNSAAAPAAHHTDLTALDEEIAKLPPSATDAYRKALIKCPGEVSDERRKDFLECEEGNPSLAAQRLAKYWEFRLEYFGPDKCFLPMTLTGAMADEMMPMAERRIYQLLPCTDNSGRAIMILRLSHRDFSTYSLEQEIMAYFYLCETIVRNKRVSNGGMVLLVDGRDASRKHYSRTFPKIAKHLFDNTVPIRVRAFHICYPSHVMFYIVHPIVKNFMSKTVRLRTVLHHGFTSAVLQSLAGYNLTPDCLPTELGGNVRLDMNEFLMDRLTAEAAALGLKLQPVGQDNNVGAAEAEAEAEADAPPAKRPRNVDETEMSETSASVTPPELSVASSAHSQSSPSGDAIEYSGISAAATATKTPKRRKPNNVVDPRMALAVKAKQNNPKMKLYDALVAGGFVFTKDPETKDMLDQEGTSLTQRKNNLCRRIRIEKQKQEKEAKKKNANIKAGMGDVAMEHQKHGSTRVPPPQKLEASLSVGRAPANERPNEGSGATEGCDSLIEDILELPGLDEFEDGDILNFLDNEGEDGKIPAVHVRPMP